MMSDISKRDFIKLGILALSDSACTIVVNPKVMEALYSDEPANIRKVINSYRLLHTTLDYEADNTSYQTNHLGTGIAYGNLILTLDHIVTFSPFELNIIRERYNAQSIRKIKEETFLQGHKLESIVKDSDSDLAVLRHPQVQLQSPHNSFYPFEIGDSDKLRYGQPIILIGNPGSRGWNIREGIISSHVMKSPSGSEGFYISPLVERGDSGSAVVDKHTFQLLGLVAEIYGISSFARPINMFKPYL